MNLFLKVIKQPFRRGVNFNYVRIFFSSQHRSETSFDVQKVKLICLYICGQLSVFSKYLRQRVPYKVKTWHALLHKQYFSKHRFLDIC